MVEAQDPGLPRGRTFRSQPEPVRRVKANAECLTAARPPGLARQPRKLSGRELGLLMARRRALPPEGPVFFPALAFRLPLARVWVSRRSCLWARLLSPEIFSSLPSVWVWACGAFLILVKRRWAGEFRAESALAMPPRPRRISSPTLPCERAAIPVSSAIRYRRQQTFLLPVSFPTLGSAIFWLLRKAPFRFLTLRLLISRVESRLALFLELQKFDASSLPCPMLPLLLESGSEISLVSETRWRVSRFAPIRRAGFSVRH